MSSTHHSHNTGCS